MGVRLDNWFSINVSILIILTLALTETSCNSKTGKTPLKCHLESVWNETSKNCSVVNKWTNTVESVTATGTGCKPGYYGINCSQPCMYPHFGVGCQQNCSCRKEQCDLSVGCSKKTTTMYVRTSVLMSGMDNKTVKMDKKTVEMDNMTVEIDRPKETFLGTLFNTNNMSLMVVSIVSLILITLMIVLAYKLIRKKCSQRRIFNCHHKEKLPDDSMHGPVHYEEILNITVLSTVEGQESFHQSNID